MDAHQIAERGHGLLAEGWQAVEARDWRCAEHAFEKALAIGERLDRQESDLEMLARLGLAQVRYGQGDLVQAVEEGARAVAAGEDSIDIHGWQIPLYQLMAGAWEEIDQPHQAVSFRQAVVALLRQQQEDEPSLELAESCYLLGETLQRLGLCPDAARSFEEAASIYEMHQPEQKANLAATLERFGPVLSRAGDYAEAGRVFDRLLPLVRELAGADSSAESSLWSNRGTMLGEAGRFEEANESFTRAEQIRAGLAETSPASMALLWSNWSHSLRREGKVGRARDLAARGAKALAEARSPALYVALDALSRAIQADGDTAGAETVCRQALERMEAHRLADLSEWTRVLDWHARLLDELGRPDDALEARERAAAVAAMAAEPCAAEALAAH
ncbi:MAG: tetratricopeptide repeat protein [Bryobacteraceae bacterium]